jgi:hypothetical protein
MIVKELLDLFGCWNKIKILDWDVPEESVEDSDDAATLFYGYADDTPYRLIDCEIVTQKQINEGNYDTSPLNVLYDKEKNTAYLQVWVKL